jgi:hypothetical protein
MMTGSAKKTSDKALAYQREYYRKNAERIRDQYYKEKEQIRGRKKCNSLLEMLQEWNLRLTERLLDQDLDNWLRWALELTREENNRQIEQINGRAQEGHTSEKD